MKTSQDLRQLRQRMDDTGIGFAGIDGVWWLPAYKPFDLPPSTAVTLTEIGQAIFVLFDVVLALFKSRTCPEINELLTYKVPEQLRQWAGNGRVLSFRPDFQLRPLPGGGYQLVITELEICPSSHGFAHAMQVGYGLSTDLVESFARFLNGRTFLFVSTIQWSEFLFEQLAFCRALAEVGGCGRVLIDVPMETLMDEIQRGERWLPPMFGIQTKTDDWDDNFLHRIKKHDLGQYLWPDGVWPEDVGDAGVFRFGYCDCFAPDKLSYFEKWGESGATILNPASFILDSKVVMALAREKAVRQHLSSDLLSILDQCIPETRLLEPHNMDDLLVEKDDWIIKYAGFDGDNQAWGGRSLQVGATHSPDSWRHVLAGTLALPWPVVAQRSVPSGRVDISYIDRDDKVHVMENGRSRLRTFFLRDGETVVYCGSHITVSNGGMQVAESTGAVQAPVILMKTAD